MSTLTNIEKQKLERALGMEGGWVLDFSNRTFGDFFRDTVTVDINGAMYHAYTGSKAHRMRAFWEKATDAQVVCMFEALLDAWELYSKDKKPAPPDSRQIIEKVIGRLDPKKAIPKAREKPLPEASMPAERAADFLKKLLEITKLEPHPRGYAFEKFLNELFAANHLAPRSPFRLTGEQIDGSFVLHNETYLLEAKWTGGQTAAADLRNFQGKVEGKATWSRGLFVSMSGFSSDGLESFGRGKSIICMDCADLVLLLQRNLNIAEILAAKVRRMAEEGSVFVPVRELL
jgi:hypothetical protein